MHRRFVLGRWALGAVLCFVAASLSHSETIQLSVEGGLADRLASLEVFERDGTRYVSLRSVVEQAGGAFSVLPTRARVDLYGETAWVRAGEDRVHALSIFSLSRPIRQDGEHMLIAIQDLADFFQKSFRKDVRIIGGGVPSSPPASGAPQNSMTIATPAPSGPRIVEAPRESRVLEGLERKPPAAAPKLPGEYRTLVIDPGHGGYDTGAQAGEAVSEDELALALAKLVKARVSTGGPIRALLTREADSDLTRSQRQSAISAVKPDFVISIHLGTSLSPTVDGIATFYAPPTTITTGGLLSGGVTTATIGEELSDESRRLAQAVGSALEASTGAPLRGVVQAPIRTLDDVPVPSILVEVGCLTGPNSVSMLVDPVYQGRIADGIANGIKAFANRESPAPATGAVDEAVEPLTPEAAPAPEAD